MIKFPVFVPEPVRQFVNHYAVDSAGIVDREGEIDGERKSARLIRLATDDRMKPAFAILIGELTNEQAWRDFMMAAWHTRSDYDELRDRVQHARALQVKIDKASQQLADLLRELQSGDGVEVPLELIFVRELLRSTTPGFTAADPCAMWKRLRGDLFGDRGDMVGAGHLRHVWSLAPSVIDLVEGIGAAVRDWDPTPRVVAIASRKRSRTTQYVRSVAAKLVGAGIKLTPAMTRALAIVVNVAINDPDADMSADDVRKALAGATEDSTETARPESSAGTEDSTLSSGPESP